MPFDPWPVRRVLRSPDAQPPARGWPVDIPAVQQLLDDGLSLGPLTVLIGDNGAGKSTLVEAVAMAFGLNAEGGSTGAQHRTWASESPLHDWLMLQRNAGAPRWGYFLRNETMHGLYSYLDGSRSESDTPDPHWHRLSHGQSFLGMLETRRFAQPGFFAFDEPEAGLSFTAQLRVVGHLLDIVAGGGQVLVATHSPVIAATPGATVLELGDHGFRPVEWEDLDTVFHYRSFLAAPERYLRHLT